MNNVRPMMTSADRMRQRQAGSERYLAAVDRVLDRYRDINPLMAVLLPAEVPELDAARPFRSFSVLERLLACHWGIEAALENQLDEVSAYPFLLVCRERRKALDVELRDKIRAWLPPDELIKCSERTIAAGSAMAGFDFLEAERGLALLRSVADEFGVDLPRLRPRPALMARENEEGFKRILQGVFKDSRRVGARLLDRVKEASPAAVINGMLEAPHLYGNLRRGGAALLGRIDADDLALLLGVVSSDQTETSSD